MYISDQLVIEEKVEIEHNKVASDAEKVEIKDKNDLLGARKVEIGAKTFLLPKSVTQKTIDHARMLYFYFNDTDVFTRAEVEIVTGLKTAGAAKMIRLLLDLGILCKVKGQGKGRYRFSASN